MSQLRNTPVNVTPDTERPTHHISLSDGNITLGLIAVDAQGINNAQAISRGTVPRTAMKTTTGNESYASFEPPWSPIVQMDWSGGRANLEFERDTTSYYDGYQVNSLFGNLYNAPQEQFSTGYRDAISNVPGSVSWSSLIPGSRAYLGYQFRPDTSFSACEITLWVKRRGTPTANLTVELCANNLGTPSTVLKTATISTSDITDTISRRFRVTISAQALTALTYYWVKVYSSGGTDTDCWLVGVKNAAGTSKESTTGSSWTSSAIDLYTRITDAASSYKTLFFQYKYAQYMIRQLASGAPKLYINGDRGACDPNTGDLTQLVDATKNWSTSGMWAGCVAKIFEGTGLVDDSIERTLTAVNGSGTITCSPAWNAAHNTDTSYVIVGSNRWTEISGHGITAPVTDVLVVNNIVYFALGDDVVIRRMREYNNAGVWTREFDDDTANKAYKLCTVRDATNGLEIWRANNKDANGAISVSKAPVIDWSASDLVFATAIVLKDDQGKINRITEYGDTSKQLYILREGILGNVDTGKYDEIELKEIRGLMDASNGKVVLRHNVYLYFNLGVRLERYYDRNLEDIGPNRNEGLPDERNGTLSCGVGLPGMILIGVNGGDGKYSTILANSGSSGGAGYSEIYRSMMASDRLWDMQYQVIPGSAMDRVWVGIGSDVIYLPWNIDRPRNGVNTFTHESVVVSSYIHAGYYDIYKFCHTMKLFAENLEAGVVWVEIDYQTDNETDWHELPQVFDDMSAESALTDAMGVNGKRIRYRMRMQTTDNSKSVRIKSTVLDTIARVPLTYSYSTQYRVMDDDINLLGEHDPLTAVEKQAIIDRWAVQLIPLRMRCTRRLFDDKVVFIDPSPASPRADMLEKYVETITVIEVRPDEGAA